VRDLREQANNPNGSLDRSHLGPLPFEIFSDRRLGIDRGKFGNAVVTSLAPRGGLRTVKDLVFWTFGLRRSATQSSAWNRCMSMWMSRGAVIARSKLNPASCLLLSVDIEVQWLGVEVMILRQYRQTCVSGTIRCIWSWISLSWTYRAISETTSGSNLFTGRNVLRKEGMRSKTSRARVSRFSI